MVTLTLIRTPRKGSGKQIHLAYKIMPKYIRDHINAVRSHTFRFRLLEVPNYGFERWSPWPKFGQLGKGPESKSTWRLNAARVHWRSYQCCKIPYLSFPASVSAELWVSAMVLIRTTRKGSGKQIHLAPWPLRMCIRDLINAVRSHTFSFRLL